MREKLFLSACLLFLAVFATSAVPTATLSAPAFTNSTNPTFTISSTDANGMEFSCTSTFTGIFVPIATTDYNEFNITDTSAGCNSNDENKQIFLRVESEDANFFDTNVWVAYDGTKPTISAVAPPGWQKNNFDVNFFPADNFSGIASITSSYGTVDQNKLVITIDGNHAITFYATDNAGNNSDSNVVYALLDKTGPSTPSISQPSGSAWFNASTSDPYSIICSGATDTATGVASYAIEQSSDNSSWNNICTGDADGTCSWDWDSSIASNKSSWYLRCKAVDAMGNESSYGILTFAGIDTNAPAVSITNPVAGNPTINSSGISFQYSGIDNGSGIKKYYVKIDSEAWIDNGTDTSREFSGISNGSHTLYVKATDNADNNSLEYSASFTVSTTVNPTPSPTPTVQKPTIQWSFPLNNSTISGIVKLKAKASSSSGINKVAFYYSSTLIGNSVSREGTDYVMDWNTAGLSDANYLLTATAYDTFNISAMDVITVNVSKTALNAANSENLSRLSAELSDKNSELQKLLQQIKEHSILPSLNSSNLIEEATEELERAKKFEKDKNSNALNASLKILNEFLKKLEENFSISSLTRKKITFKESTESSNLLSGLAVQAFGSNKQAAKNALPERFVEIVKIRDHNSTYYKAGVLIKIRNNSKAKKKFTIIEKIPKSIAQKASEISSIEKFKILEKDPVIAFEKEIGAGETAEIYYSLNKSIAYESKALLLASEETIQEFKNPPLILEEKQKENAENNLLNYGIIGVIIIAIIAVIAFFFLKSKGNEEWSYNGVSKDSKVKSKNSGTSRKKFVKEKTKEIPKLSKFKRKGIAGLD